jgi:hypothetical protein
VSALCMPRCEMAALTRKPTALSTVEPMPAALATWDAATCDFSA